MKRPTPNLALKLAIVESGVSQRVIAKRTRIPETKLSHFVRGRLVPTDKEIDRLARALNKPVDALFPILEQAS